ncbi:MAG: GTP cyclohydrolase, FolE2/MptA family, partial [Pseudomonadota bacterium]|nr:GTP cyclohydrolase, FolE2/MptA family [Pseudomonadota bacterium]
MNKPIPDPMLKSEIADVQGRPDTRNLTIDKVGVKDVRHPIRVKDRSGWE